MALLLHFCVLNSVFPVSSIAEGVEEFFRVVGAHEGFADEDGLGAGGTDAGGVLRGRDAGFGDGEDVIGDLGDDFFGEGEVHVEGGEVAVVDAEEAGVEVEGAFEFGFVVDFEEGVEAGELGGVAEAGEGVVVEGADDEEDGAGAGFGGFNDLDGVHHEVLAEAGNVAVGGDLELDDVPEVAEGAAEEFFVGEDGDGVGAGVGVAAGLLGGVGESGDVAGGGGAALDFGDDAEAAGLVEGLGEGGAGAGDLGEAGEFAVADGAEARGDFAALVGEDFGEFVHAGRGDLTAKDAEDAKIFMGGGEGRKEEEV